MGASTHLHRIEEGINMVVIEKVPTGIKGFDDIVEGGLPRPGITYIIGHPGVGKTTLALQILYNRALQGEKGMYVSLTEKKESVITRYKDFPAFNRLEEFLQKKQLMFFEAIPTYGLGKDMVISLIDDAFNIAQENSVKNIIFDTVTSLTMYLRRDEVRTILSYINDKIYSSKTMGIMIAELPLYSEIINPPNEEFLCDVLIVMDYVWIYAGAPKLDVRLIPVKSRVGRVDRRSYIAVISPETGVEIIGTIETEHFTPFRQG